MSQLTDAMITIFTAIVGVAILSVLVSRNSQTGNVLTSFGQMFSNSLSAATAPVTGKASAPNVGSSMAFGGAMTNFQMPF